MAAAETWTHGKLLEWTQDYLRDQGCENARLDAEVLLAEAAGCQRIDLYATFNEEATEECRVAYRELVRRRAEGTPVAYLVGRREFFSLMFRVTPDTLIPRPETEHLVVAALDWIKELRKQDPDRSVTVADVGTGSGIIAVCLAKHADNIQVVATDLSSAALEIAKKNATAHQVDDVIDFREGDLLAPLQGETVDLIVSNPPYVSQDELREADREVRDHEPHLALVGGPTGTEIIQRLVPQAVDCLAPGGSLFMEISPMIEPLVREIIVESTQLTLGSTINDLAGLPRVVCATRNP